MSAENLKAPGIAKRVLISICVNVLSFFIITLLIVSLSAPESNGFFGISSFGVGLFIAIIGVLFVALPSSLVVAVAAPKFIHQVSYMAAASLSTSVLVTLFWAGLLFSSSNYFEIAPFAGIFLVGSISNFVAFYFIRKNSIEFPREDLSILH